MHFEPNEDGGHGAANVEGRHVGRQWRLMRDSRCGGEAALASHDHPTIRVASLVVILYLFSDPTWTTLRVDLKAQRNGFCQDFQRFLYN